MLLGQMKQQLAPLQFYSAVVLVQLKNGHCISLGKSLIYGYLSCCYWYSSGPLDFQRYTAKYFT